jgi:hypothetical protein
LLGSFGRAGRHGEDCLAAEVPDAGGGTMSNAWEWMANDEADYLRFDSGRSSHYLPVTSAREIFIALIAAEFWEVPGAPRDATRECPFEGKFKCILGIAENSDKTSDPTRINQSIERILGRDAVTSLLRGDEDVTLTPRVAELKEVAQ